MILVWCLPDADMTKHRYGSLHERLCNALHIREQECQIAVVMSRFIIRLPIDLMIQLT